MRGSLPRVALIGLLAMSGCGGSGHGSSGGGSAAPFVATAGGVLADGAQGIATFADGSCVVAGSFSSPATFGAGEPGVTTLMPTGSSDMFVARYGSDGSLAWARRAGGTSVVMSVRAVDALPDGACLVAGTFDMTATFGAGTPNVTTLVDLNNMGDVFVARYEADGAFAWAKRAGRDFHDAADGISAFDDGSFLLTGRFTTIAVFGLGEPGVTVLNSAGGQDVFVARYNADGTLAWARSAGGAAQDIGLDVATFPDGSFVATGVCQTPATFGPGDPNQTVLTGSGIQSSFAARYNADGTLAWAKRQGGGDFTEGLGISVFPDQSFVVAGFFTGVATFGPGEPGEVVISSLLPATNDAFVARFDAGGHLLWVRRAGGSGNDTCRRVEAHADGSCVVGGEYEAIAAFGQGEANQTFLLPGGMVDAFVARYDANGFLRWARGAGGASGDDRCFDVAVFPDGTFAACGTHVDNAVFNIGAPGGPIVPGHDPLNPDLFVARYTAAGGL